MKKKDNTELITQKATKAPKSGKTLKGQLFSAVAMMLVATIALGSSTYAWFINNRTVEVENMQLAVSTSASLLVAVQKTDLTTYTGTKSLIANADITGAAEGNWVDFLTTPLVPASITDENLAKAVALRDLQFYVTNNHVSNGKLDQFDAMTRAVDKTGVGQGPVKRLSLQFTASNAMKVYFGAKDLTNIADMITAGAATTIDGADAAAQATAIKKALRVAVCPTGGTPVVFQFDAGTAGKDGNNTDYSHAVPAYTAVQDETTGKYDGIGAVDASKYVKTPALLTAKLPTAAGTDYLATVDANGAVTAPTTTGKELFSLTAATPLVVDLYIWLDGTDNDCLNVLSAYGFNLRLPFAGVPTTTP